MDPQTVQFNLTFFRDTIKYEYVVNSPRISGGDPNLDAWSNSLNYWLQMGT